MLLSDLPPGVLLLSWEALVEWLVQNVPSPAQRVRIKQMIEEARGEFMPRELFLRLIGRD